MDVRFVGEFFPPPSVDAADTTTFYCVWGSNTTLPFFETVWPAVRIDTQHVDCLDIPIYESSVLPDPTYVDLQLSYNLQEYWGLKRILYYPKIVIDTLSQHNFSQTQRKLVVGLYGLNFINTPNITCRLENTESVYLGVHLSDHVFFQSPQEL